MPRSSPVGSSARCSVSGADVSAAIVSHGAFAARCAVHGGGASPCAVESTSVADCVAPLPAGADSTTRDGVTPITLLGGASNSLPTLQPMTSARPVRKARLPCFVRIECPLAAARSIPGVARRSTWMHCCCGTMRVALVPHASCSILAAGGGRCGSGGQRRVAVPDIVHHQPAAVLLSPAHDVFARVDRGHARWQFRAGGEGPMPPVRLNGDRSTAHYRHGTEGENRVRVH